MRKKIDEFDQKYILTFSHLSNMKMSQYIFDHTPMNFIHLNLTFSPKCPEFSFEYEHPTLKSVVYMKEMVHL